MANYETWNKKIYDFYFENKADKNSFLFSVNKNDIEVIGKSLEIYSNATDDFIKSVLGEIGRFRNNKFTIKLNNAIKNTNSIPNQTAIIAFFIYIASTMSKYNKNAYWPKVEDTIKNFYPEVNIKNLKNNTQGLYIELFEDFAQKISEKFDTDFRFKNPFSSWKYAGIPMFQVMISEKDYCLLTQKFDDFEKRNGNHPAFNEKIVKETRDNSKFSISYRLFCRSENSDLSKIFCERIQNLYEFWKSGGKIVYEFDEINFRKKRKNINLLYGYFEPSENAIQWLYTAENQNDYDEIEFSDGIFRKKENNSYYSEILIPQEKLSLENYLSYSTNIYNLTVQRQKTNCIKFKKEGKIYIEKTAKNSIKEGDTFSILANEQFFSNRWDDIEQIIDEELTAERLIKIKGTNLWLLNDITAQYADNDIVAFNPSNKIEFKKGLKTQNGNYTWIKGAEPIIELYDMRYVKISNDNEWMIEREKTLDIRQKYNSLGEHQIKLETSDYKKSYSVADISEMKNSEPKGFYEIYNIIEKNKIYNSKEKHNEIPCVFGADIANFKNFTNENNSQLISEKKLFYIFKILQNHKNKRNFKIPKKLKTNIENLSLNYSKIISDTVKKFFENNNLIDSYIYYYLTKIGA